MSVAHPDVAKITGSKLAQFTARANPLFPCSQHLSNRAEQVLPRGLKGRGRGFTPSEVECVVRTPDIGDVGVAVVSYVSEHLDSPSQYFNSDDAVAGPLQCGRRMPDD
jgi:hypothetical protein